MAQLHTARSALFHQDQAPSLLQAQPEVRVYPNGFSRYLISFHGSVTRDHILDRTGYHVSNMRLAVCCWRSVIECVCLALFTAVHTLFENLVVFPEFLDSFSRSTKFRFVSTLRYTIFTSCVWLLAAASSVRPQRIVSSQIPVRANASGTYKKRPHPVKGRSLIRCTTCYIIRACVRIPASYALCYGAGRCSMSVHSGQFFVSADICSL